MPEVIKFKGEKPKFRRHAHGTSTPDVPESNAQSQSAVPSRVVMKCNKHEMPKEEVSKGEHHDPPAPDIPDHPRTLRIPKEAEVREVVSEVVRSFGALYRRAHQRVPTFLNEGRFARELLRRLDQRKRAAADNVERALRELPNKEQRDRRIMEVLRPIRRSDLIRMTQRICWQAQKAARTGLELIPATSRPDDPPARRVSHERFAHRRRSRFSFAA